MKNNGMNCYKNEFASFCCSGRIYNSLNEFFQIIKDYPSILVPDKGDNKEKEELLSSAGFKLYSTVKKTTLFYDRKTDCFFKILHPLSFKTKIIFCYTDRSRQIKKIYDRLTFRNVKLPLIEAYGKFKKDRMPFYVVRRLEGRSVYDVVIREKNIIEMKVYRDIIDEIVKVHSNGYWLGDAHLSHIFINGGKVSGFIDIDSIRKNIPYQLRNLAKDIAGFHHPELPLDYEKKAELIGYYINKMKIKDRAKFIRLVKNYTERRWKA